MKFQLLFSFMLLASSSHAARIDPDALRQQANTIVAKTRKQQPAYDQLAEQQNDYLVNWRERMRQYLAIHGNHNTSAASRAIATALALNVSTTYLNRSHDTAIDALLLQQRRLMTLAQSDPLLCNILLNSASARQDESGRIPWLLRTPYNAMMPELESALLQVIQGAQDIAPRTLPVEQNSQFTQRVSTRIRERYGEEGLNDLARLQNDNTAALQRCRGISRLLEVIAEQPLELRAQLMRIYFGQ